MRKRTEETQAQESRALGAFRADGSYNDDGQHSDRGPVDAFIRTLVRSRSRTTPAQAAAAIGAANRTEAFPNWQRWRDGRMESGEPLWWSAAQTSSAAEEAVKREGRGTEGHWCGERWMPGPEKACREERHRLIPSREQVAEYVAAIIRKLEGAPASKAGAVMAEPETRWPMADETWDGWEKVGLDPSAEKAARLRSFGLHPGFHRDDAVAGA